MNPNFEIDYDAIVDAVKALDDLRAGTETREKVGDLTADSILVEAGNVLERFCYGASAKSGWWHDPKTGEPLVRDKGTMVALIHSELSEALEGIRKSQMDDHLTDRPMAEVEFADTLIRIFDFTGGFRLGLGQHLRAVLSQAQGEDFTKLSLPSQITYAHACVSLAYLPITELPENAYFDDAAIKTQIDGVGEFLACTVMVIMAAGRQAGYDIAGAVSAKMRYNQQRADHKSANRAAAGGKAF